MMGKSGRDSQGRAYVHTSNPVLALVGSGMGHFHRCHRKGKNTWVRAGKFYEFGCRVQYVSLADFAG